MYPLLINDIIQYTLEYNVLNQVCLNVLNYRVLELVAPVNDGNDALFEMLAELEGPGGIVNAVPPAIASNVTLVRHSAQKVRPTRFVRVSQLLNLPGTFPGNCTAPNVAAVITKKPIQSKRGLLGSVHVPGLSQEAYLGGTITPALIGSLDTLALRIRTVQVLAVTGVTLEPVLLSAATAFAPKPVASVEIQSTLRVMRRRTVGVGI